MARTQPRVCIFLLAANIIAKTLNPKMHSLCLQLQCEHIRQKSDELWYCGLAGEDTGMNSIYIKEVNL